MFDSRGSLLGFLMLVFNGICHSLSTDYREPFNTAASDIFILAGSSIIYFHIIFTVDLYVVSISKCSGTK